MTISDYALAAGGSATRHRISADQRRRLAAVPSSLPPWLTPSQTLRTAAQEIAQELGVPVAFAGQRRGAWLVLGESREESSTLGARIGAGPTFAQAVDRLRDVPAARWEQEGREHTLVPLPIGAAGHAVVLVIEGDWTLSSSELQDCAAALVDGPARAAAPPGGSAELLARELAKAGDAAEACEALVRFAVAAVPCRYASVALPAPDRTLSVVAAHGYAVALTSHVRIEPGRGLIGAVLPSRPSAARARRRRVPRRRADARAVSHQVVRRRAGDRRHGRARRACVWPIATATCPFVADDVARLGALVAPAALALARLRTERDARAWRRPRSSIRRAASSIASTSRAACRRNCSARRGRAPRCRCRSSTSTRSSWSTIVTGIWPATRSSKTWPTSCGAPSASSTSARATAATSSPW